MLFQPSGYELKIIDECELTRSELGFLRDDRQFAPKLLVSFPDYRPTGDFGFTGNNGEREPLKQRKVHVNVQRFRLETSKAIA